MPIEYLYIAIIGIDRNRFIIFLENQSAMLSIFPPMKRSQLTSCPFCAVCGSCSQMGLLLVAPGGTILQIQVQLTDIMHSITTRTIVGIVLVIGCSAGPERVFIRKCHIQDTGIGPVYQFSATILHHFLSILAGNIHITDNFSGSSTCFSIFHIDVHSTFFYTGRIVVMTLIIVSCRSNGTSTYGNLRTGPDCF